MRKKQQKLISYLYASNQKITADSLAKRLNLSVRTIKSYIAELNMSYPHLISSSNRGYIINKKQASFLLQCDHDLP